MRGCRSEQYESDSEIVSWGGGVIAGGVCGDLVWRGKEQGECSCVFTANDTFQLQRFISVCAPKNPIVRVRSLFSRLKLTQRLWISKKFVK